MSSKICNYSICICIFICNIVFSNASAQNKIDYRQINPFLFPRYGLQSSVASHEESFPLNAARFFGTLTLTLATSTSIYTITTTTTCTTSTTAIKVCSPSKGRRRRDNFGIHRLIFEEEDFDSDIYAPRKPEDR